MLAPITHGAEPWAIYALQRAIGVKPATGSFGDATARKLKVWQRSRGLEADGIAGPITQATILAEAGAQADAAHHLPKGVGYGFAVWEGGGVLAATNWDTPGAVDCGPAEYRISGPPFDPVDLKEAFRPYFTIDKACGRVRHKQVEYMAANAHLKAEPPVALEVAVLFHHWQVGAARVAQTYTGGGSWWRRVPDPDDRAGVGEQWPPEGYSRAEWSREYARRILSFTVGP